MICLLLYFVSQPLIPGGFLQIRFDYAGNRFPVPPVLQTVLRRVEERQYMSAVDCRTQVTEPATSDNDGVVRARPRFRGRVILIELALAVGLAGAYVAYERIGTSANASFVEFTRNLAGGFLAVGMSDDAPGFIVLSAMDQEFVEVRADRMINQLAGTRTQASVETPTQSWSARLRGPQVVIVDEQGGVEAFGVDWTLEEFLQIRNAADCLHAKGSHKVRCGAPFADLSDLLSDWPAGRIPQRVAGFLAIFEHSDSVALGLPGRMLFVSVMSDLLTRQLVNS